MHKHSKAVRATAAAVFALLAAGAQATENGQVRALLGAPSYELATPQFPGWYGQVWLQHYEADKLRGDDGKALTTTAPTPLGNLTLNVDGKIRADVLVPRFTYIADTVIADGHLGFSATLPVVHQTTDIKLSATLPPGLTAGQIGLVNGLLAQQSAARSGSHTGLADAEIAGFVDWAQDVSRVVAGLAVGVPTGDYDKNRAVNTGAGNFWTLRPLVVASRVWDNGLSAGLRATYSFNTKNTDTEVRSGQYLHVDWMGMYRLNDRWSAGLQGYVLKQFTADSGPGVAADGNKVQALSAGPVVGYISESGNWALDFKVMQEFSVRNRPEGVLAWARLNFRFE
jgi:hypothetical protein